MAQEATIIRAAAAAARAVVAPAYARVAAAVRRFCRRLRQPSPLRGVVSLRDGTRMTRRELAALRKLGLVPAIRGGSGEGEGGTDEGGEDTSDAAAGRSAATGGSVTEDGETFSREYVERLRREAAGYRTELRDVQQQIQGFEDRNKSDLEKALARAEKAEKASVDSQQELWRLRAANKHAIPEDLVDLISGANEQEMLDRAERIAKHLKTSTTRVPGGPQGKDSPASLDEQISEAERKGDYAKAMELKAQKMAPSGA